MLEARDTLLRVIVPALPLRRFLQRGRAIARAFCITRKNRPMQLTRVREILQGY